MRLVRFDAGAGPRMGVVDGTRVIDLREAGLDFPDLLSIIHAGQHGLAKIDALIGTAGPGR